MRIDKPKNKLGSKKGFYIPCLVPSFCVHLISRLSSKIIRDS